MIDLIVDEIEYCSVDGLIVESEGGFCLLETVRGYRWPEPVEQFGELIPTLRDLPFALGDGGGDLL